MPALLVFGFQIAWNIVCILASVPLSSISEVRGRSWALRDTMVLNPPLQALYQPLGASVLTFIWTRPVDPNITLPAGEGHRGGHLSGKQQNIFAGGSGTQQEVLEKVLFQGFDMCFLFWGCERQKPQQINRTLMRCHLPGRTSWEQMGKLRQKAVPETWPDECCSTTREKEITCMLHCIWFSKHSYLSPNREGRGVTGEEI